MGFLEGIEKLITEHGSAAILKERLLLVADQYAALEKALAASEAKAKDVLTQKEHLELELRQAKEEIQGLKDSLSHGSNPEKYVCDHCACTTLTRTGTRPHPTFGGVGVKEALFRCASCGKESAFELPLP